MNELIKRIIGLATVFIIIPIIIYVTVSTLYSGAESGFFYFAVLFVYFLVALGIIYFVFPVFFASIKRLWTAEPEPDIERRGADYALNVDRRYIPRLEQTERQPIPVAATRTFNMEGPGDANPRPEQPRFFSYEVRMCPECGTPNRKTEKQCTKCAAILPAYVPPPPPPEDAAQAGPAPVPIQNEQANTSKNVQQDSGQTTDPGWR